MDKDYNFQIKKEIKSKPLHSRRSSTLRLRNPVAIAPKSESVTPGKNDREANCERSSSTSPGNRSAMRRSMAWPARARRTRRSELWIWSHRLHTRPKASRSTSRSSLASTARSSSSVRASLMAILWPPSGAAIGGIGEN